MDDRGNPRRARGFWLAVAVLALGPARGAVAGPTKADHFEIVGQPRYAAGNEVVDVRFVHGDGKPVADGFIFSVSANMAPDGMPRMTAPVLPENGTTPGAFTFRFEPTMKGRWAIVIEAKRHMGQDTVQAEIPVEVAQETDRRP